MSKKEILQKYFNVSTVPQLKKKFPILKPYNAYQVHIMAKKAGVILENKWYFEKKKHIKQRITNKNKFATVLKEVNAKNQAKQKIANFIERHTNNGMTLKQMKNLVEKVLRLKSPDDLECHFEIVLQSAVVDVKRKFKFNGITHFLNFWDKVINSVEVLDYNYTNT